jgi:biopolymer transport protein ExbB
MFFQETTDPSAQAAPPPPADTAAAALPGMGGNSNAEALSQIGFGEFIHHLDVLGWIVFIVLLAMSLLSWYFIIANFIRNAMVSSRADKVIRSFWDTSSAQESIREMEQQPKAEPFSKIALDCASAAAHHQRADAGRLAESLNRSEFIDRALRQAVARESLRLEGGLTLLATVGSSAPFVGLLGTVWGIYHALINLGAAGESSITAVAGPVGEALIMTAFGLFTAIPAVLAYNFYVRANRLTYAKFDEFAHDLHDFFATGARVDTGAPSAKK